jgi:apolipoprotein N-acyltransferase
VSALNRIRTSSTTPSLLVGVLGGLIASASLPPLGFWLAGPLGVAMVLLALEDRPASRRALTGWCFGLGLLVPGLWWAQHFNWYGALALMAFEALFFAAAAAAIAPSRGRTLSAVGALTLAEVARSSFPLGGLPIGGLPLGQVGGPLLSVSRLAGPAGLVMAVVVAAAGARILSTALAARDARTGDAALRTMHGVALIAMVCIVGIVGAASSAGNPGSSITVAAVQGGGERGTSAQQTDPVGVTKAQLAATQEVPTGTDLTVLPEDVIGLSGPLRGSWQLAALRAQAQRTSTTLLAGVTSPVGANRFSNSVIALGPDGRWIGSVTKIHRVPFGEYVPARSLVSSLADVSAVPRDATVGTTTEVLDTDAGRLGVLISFETFFSSLGSDLVDAKAELFVVPTNTTSYPGSQMPAQELAASRLQAVEHGRDLVQASPTGYSALIRSDGSVIARSELSRRIAVTGTLTSRSGKTVFDSIGPWPILLLAGACLIVGQARALSRRRQQADRDEADQSS